MILTGPLGRTVWNQRFLFRFFKFVAEFRNETEYTEWSECTKTCGMGIQSRASKNGEQTQSRFCNTDQCPGMLFYVNS